MSNDFKRTDRVGEMIQRKLASIIQQEIGQSGFVTLSSVTVARDLAHAKVYFTVFNADHKATEDLLNANAAHFRTLLSKILTTRTVPQLHFIYDTSLEYAQKLTRLIDSVNPDEGKDST